jgi:hypothetical protein
MKPFLTQFEVEIPDEPKSECEFSYDPQRMLLMMNGRPAAEQSELVREPSTKKTFVHQETYDDN